MVLEELFMGRLQKRCFKNQAKYTRSGIFDNCTSPKDVYYAAKMVAVMVHDVVEAAE